MRIHYISDHRSVRTVLRGPTLSGPFLWFGQVTSITLPLTSDMSYSIQTLSAVASHKVDLFFHS